jgi:hypothetical protein
VTDPAHECEKCGERMHTTHSRKRGTMIDRRRECSCGYRDRVLLRLEVVKILQVVSPSSVLETHSNPVSKRTKRGKN